MKIPKVKKIENTLGSVAETWIKFFRAEEEDIYKNMTAKEIMEAVHGKMPKEKERVEAKMTKCRNCGTSYNSYCMCFPVKCEFIGINEVNICHYCYKLNLIKDVR